MVAVDRSAHRLRLAAERFGATHLVDASAEEDVAARVRELTNGGADHVFEAVGAPHLIDVALDATVRGGSVWAVGVFGDAARIDFSAAHLHSGKGVHGVRAGSLEPQRDIPHLVDGYLRGRLELEALVGERIGLDDINRGIEALAAGAGARTLVVF